MALLGGTCPPFVYSLRFTNIAPKWNHRRIYTWNKLYNINTCKDPFASCFFTKSFLLIRLFHSLKFIRLLRVVFSSQQMILLAFLSCFLVFFFVKDQLASFQLKQIIVFLNWVFPVFVYFIAWLPPNLIIEFSTLTGSELNCMQLIVWTLNMNYDRKK